LLAAAAAVFVEQGFARAQMDDVAARLGASKGTVYRAVESKDELLAAVVRWGDDPDAASLPLRPGAIVDEARTLLEALGGVIAGIGLAPAAGRRRMPLADEVEALTVRLHAALSRHRTAIMVLDRCAADVPGLAEVWFGQGRYALVDLWHDYLDRRRVPADALDHDVLARTVVELVTLWAVKMPWDPAPRRYAADTGPACAAMVRRLVTGSAA
jgi:AcrR family transcriptional regulator